MAEESERESESREITTSDHLRSDVWNFLGFPSTKGKITSKEKIICKICHVELKYHGTASNTKIHLLTLHPGKIAELTEGNGLQPRRAKINTCFTPATQRGFTEAARCC